MTNITLNYIYISCFINIFMNSLFLKYVFFLQTEKLRVVHLAATLWKRVLLIVKKTPKMKKIETVELFLKVIKNCEMARYSPINQVKMEEDYNYAIDLIEFIDKELWYGILFSLQII